MQVIKQWFHRVPEDASGCTFVEWDPSNPSDSDPDAPPVALIVNSSEVRGAGFEMKDVRLPALEARARGPATRGAGVRQLVGIGDIQWQMPTRIDNAIREWCE